MEMIDWLQNLLQNNNTKLYLFIGTYIATNMVSYRDFYRPFQIWFFVFLAMIISYHTKTYLSTTFLIFIF